MKSYRVLEPAPRPEVELMGRLDEVGFQHMLRPVAHWERNGWDLALVREYVPGAVEGRLLALTSLRDLLGRNIEDGPVRHGRGRRCRWATFLGDAPPRGDHRRAPSGPGRGIRRSRPSSATTARRSRGLIAIRVHGDYHLRRVFRTDAGWIVGGIRGRSAHRQARRADATGEPRFASPLEDLADMWYLAASGGGRGRGSTAGRRLGAEPSASRRHGSGETGALSSAVTSASRAIGTSWPWSARGR